jgi:predicted DNA-binding protein
MSEQATETTSTFALRMSRHEFAALDRLCADTGLSRAKLIRHLIMAQVDPLNAAPDILLELRKIGTAIGKNDDRGMKDLYQVVMGTAYRLADIIEPLEDD